MTAYYAGLLVDQQNRTSSLEQRGTGVITTSGAIATLLFGLVSLVTGADGFEVTGAARPLMVISVGAFALAALVGLGVLAPLPYKNVHIADIDADVWSHWDESVDRGRQRLTKTNIDMFMDAKKKNGVKADLLVAAMCAQTVGAVLIAATVVVLVLQKAG